jgi:hypothetical protein
MTDLSPQAQAIVDAFFDEWDVYARDKAMYAISAALRALAKQYTFADTAVNVTEKVVLVSDILKIATELENI